MSELPFSIVFVRKQPETDEERAIRQAKELGDYLCSDKVYKQRARAAREQLASEDDEE